MSTFLELCQDVARQSGTLAGGIALPTTVGQSGRAEKIVDWVKSAWVDLQNERQDWRWMRRAFTADLSIGTQCYTAAALSIDRHSAWVEDRSNYRPFTVYDGSIGQTDQREIRQIPYELWQRRWNRFAPSHQRPTEYAISPAREVCVGPPPDKAYKLTGEYRLAPQILAADESIPEMPDQFHKLITWGAMKLLAMSDESEPTYTFADAKFREMHYALCSDQLPQVDMRRESALV
ncbi:MAG: hypothetical protein AAFW97_14555 [Pseudomonadota bacterium]